MSRTSRLQSIGFGECVCTMVVPVLRHAGAWEWRPSPCHCFLGCNVVGLPRTGLISRCFRPFGQGCCTHGIVGELDWRNVISRVRCESGVECVCVCVCGLAGKARTAVCGVGMVVRVVLGALACCCLTCSMWG